MFLMMCMRCLTVIIGEKFKAFKTKWVNFIFLKS